HRRRPAGALALRRGRAARAAVLLSSLASQHARAAPHRWAPRVLDSEHGADGGRRHQHPEAEDAQEVGRHARAEVVHRAVEREVLAAPLYGGEPRRRRRRVSVPAAARGARRESAAAAAVAVRSLADRARAEEERWAESEWVPPRLHHGRQLGWQRYDL